MVDLKTLTGCKRTKLSEKYCIHHQKVGHMIKNDHSPNDCSHDENVPLGTFRKIRNAMYCFVTYSN